MASWSTSTDTTWEAPHSVCSDVTLPLNLPRWRWADVEPVEPEPALKHQVFGIVQRLAFDLKRGQFDALLNATQLRTEELALAYQRAPAAEAQRLRTHLQELHDAGPPSWRMPEWAAFHLRSVAQGRLFECLDAEGLPVLRADPDAKGTSHALPLRVAFVEGKVYVLR